MSTNSKRFQKAEKVFQEVTVHSLDVALDTIHAYAKQAKAKFDETVDVVIKLGVDAKQTDQMVRGAVPMPHGLGKTIRVCVVTKAERVKEAQKAGADLAGADELVEEIKNGKINFDVCIATPDMMPAMSKLGKVLGPRGLMPNPKLGTVSENIELAVKNAKSGQVEFKIDKASLIHAPVGKVSFDKKALKENIIALYNAIIAAKPSASKGVYLRSFQVSTTMGPSLKLDLDKIVG